MERRKLLLHIDAEEEEENSSKSSSVSRLLIECPRILYTVCCFIVFLSTCLFLLVLFVLLLLMNDVHSRTDRNTGASDVATTARPTTSTLYRNKQSMREYLQGLRSKNKTSPNKKSKNLTQTCFDLIQSDDDEFRFNNMTKNNVYFAKPADELIDEKFACTIESSLCLNPYKTVFLLNIESSGRSDGDAKPDGTPTVRQSHLSYLKSFYRNLKSRNIRTDAYLKGSPFENADTANRDLLKVMVKLVTLWKYSGLVSSKQNLLLSKSFYNQSTILLEKSILYSSYPQLCSPVIEKLLLAFKTLTADFRNSGDVADTIIDSAIDNVTDMCGDCDVQKLSLFQVCNVLKPSCYFVNIDSVWKTNKIELAKYCPKMVDLVTSKASETKESDKEPPVFVPTG